MELEVSEDPASLLPAWPLSHPALGPLLGRGHPAVCTSRCCCLAPPTLPLCLEPRHSFSHLLIDKLISPLLPTQSTMRWTPPEFSSHSELPLVFSVFRALPRILPDLSGSPLGEVLSSWELYSPATSPFRGPGLPSQGEGLSVHGGAPLSVLTHQLLSPYSWRSLGQQEEAALREGTLPVILGAASARSSAPA